MTNPVVRRTNETLDVLELLLAAGDDEVYGWDIAKRLELGGPTVYKILDRLTRHEMLTWRWAEPDPDSTRPRRRMYRVTEYGKTIAGQLLDRRRLFIGKVTDAIPAY
jgi:DNA-binding PadR family transcriptional regulator